MRARRPPPPAHSTSHTSVPTRFVPTGDYLNRGSCGSCKFRHNLLSSSTLRLVFYCVEPQPPHQPHATHGYPRANLPPQTHPSFPDPVPTPKHPNIPTLQSYRCCASTEELALKEGLREAVGAAARWNRDVGALDGADRHQYGERPVLKHQYERRGCWCRSGNWSLAAIGSFGNWFYTDEAAVQSCAVHPRSRAGVRF